MRFRRQGTSETYSLCTYSTLRFMQFPEYLSCCRCEACARWKPNFPQLKNLAPSRAVPQVLEKVLNLCVAPDLGCLEATCTYFLKTGITESIARSKLKEIPRARGLKPEKKNRETHVSLLNFVNCQSQAAAQSTAVAFGAYHSASLLIPGDSRICPTTGKPLEHSLYSFGRGFHGQLGQVL